MLSTMSRLPLTRAGEAEVLAEIEYLDSIRAELLAELQAATRQGLAHEEARLSGELAALALQIGRLRDILAWSRPLEGGDDAPVATIGCEITVQEADAEQVFNIVCPSRANPSLGRVSFESPFAKAVMGRGVGEEVEVTLPEGHRRLRIVAIRPEKPKPAAVGELGPTALAS